MLFLDKKQAQKYAIDYEALYNEGIWILKPEYIPDYLTRNPIPPTFNYLIDEAKSFQDGNISAPAAGKRKMSEATTQRLKRTRRRQKTILGKQILGLLFCIP